MTFNTTLFYLFVPNSIYFIRLNKILKQRGSVYKKTSASRIHHFTFKTPILASYGRQETGFENVKWLVNLITF